MDLLKAQGLDELPEQQTRTLHLVQNHPDFQLSLGFSACCTCGKSLNSSKVACPNCKRVFYCSQNCLDHDANIQLPSEIDTNEEVDTAMGHSAVICMILATCRQDDDAEANDTSRVSDTNIQSSRDRLQSERESYPATIANALAQGDCFQETLATASERGSLTIHVIGASTEGELWNEESGDTVAEAYADALSYLAESHMLENIGLIFVGPECPASHVDLQKKLPVAQGERFSGRLTIKTFRGAYVASELEQNNFPAADIVVFFNPGFTVPEYNWRTTLDSIKQGTPFLLTTNTELEGVADCQYLLDQDKIRSLPPGLADMFGLHSSSDETRVTLRKPFFNVNPFAGNRIRQNGTMANDVFIKNHWILGGVLDSFDPSKDEAVVPSKRSKNDQNSKLLNPALI